MHTTVSADPFGLDLPDGRYTVIVERGKDYHPESRTIVISGTPAAATIALQRWVDPAGLGWYSGETHVHRTLDDLPNLMRAEDLNVAFPLLDWVREAGVAPTARRDATFPAAWPEIITGRRDPRDLPAEHRVRDIHDQADAAHAGCLLRDRPADSARPGRPTGRPDRPPCAWRRR